MKFYTKTVCPKCMFVKSEISRLGFEVEVINIDENLEAKQMLITAGFVSVPVLECNGKFLNDTFEMVKYLEIRSL